MALFKGEVAARRRQMLHTGMLVLCDIVGMLMAFLSARELREVSNRPFAHAVSGLHFAGVMVEIFPLWIVIFAVCGLYRAPLTGSRYNEIGHVTAGVFGVVMVLISYDYLSAAGLSIFPSRSVPVIAVPLGIIFVSAGRQLVRQAMKYMFVRGRGLHNVILIGTGSLAERIVGALDASGSGYRVLAAVNCSGPETENLGDLPVYPMLEMALEAHKDQRIDEIVQAEPNVSHDDAVRYMAYANQHGMSYRFVPDKFGIYAAASTMGTIDGIPVMEVRLTSLDGWGAVGKRVFDVLASIGLIIALGPLLAVVAGLIKLAEPTAPVLYSQRRIGLGGREIRVFKFRSMSWKYSTGPGREFETAEDAFTAMGRTDLIPEFRQHHKVAEDPRVSRLGRFLRSTSLDELPQLLNALRGELSMVGPRPITQAELDRYGTQAISFLALKPGMTGLWQISGRSTTTYDERVKLDIYYVENWSIGLDVSILARTILTVAARKGAY